MALAVAQERQGPSSSNKSGCSSKGSPKTRRESVGRAVGGAKSNTKESPLKIVSPSGSISVSIYPLIQVYVHCCY